MRKSHEHMLSRMDSAARSARRRFRRTARRDGCFGVGCRRAEYAESHNAIPNFRGFTLLELMLALALTAVVLVLMNMAIDLHLRSLDSRRVQLEESQLARSVLRIVSDDIRGVVQTYKQDVSGVEAMLQQAAQSAVGQLAGGTGQTSGSPGSESLTAGQPPGVTNPNGNGDSGSFPTGQTNGNTGQAGNAASGAAGGSSGGGFGASGSVSSSGGASGSEAPSSADLADTDLSVASVPELPGIYGNQYQLQIDVSRLPRIDQYQANLTGEPVSTVVDIPSDVKTVTYYVKTPVESLGANLGVNPNSLAALTDPLANPTGLVRRELDRAVTSSAVEMGNVSALESSGDLIAPEVTGIEFRYFDGVEWLTEWDTSAEQKLPIAIQILLAMTTASPAKSAAAAGTTGGVVASNTRIYSMIVSLPTGGQSSGEESSASSSSSSASTGNATESSSSNSTGTQP